MTSKEIRDTFLHFFESKQHQIVPSAPMVIKNDPTLMFTNAGMNQFKDIFLGNAPVKSPRIADSQKCLRVSGKHNDLEEVGHDTYHHTMFEMLGNWSFGDYFKQEAIDWAWELLTEVFKIPTDRLYATVFEGDKADNTQLDQEAKSIWKKHLNEDRILLGNKKDNFWEMGDVGPCGPCSEIHVDIRDDAERQAVSGAELVNQDHPQVIEIWNLVFIQYNRKASGQLELLPSKHIDTGMGFERLSMVVQGVKSNYDTDVFQPLIQEIAKLSGKKYGVEDKNDIAMRVVSDHVRTIAFAIADGQLPSNNKAGYVIRRILRRAVRYGYSFLAFQEPFINKLVPVLIEVMGEAYPELKSQQDIIQKVIAEEENSFLRTLETGIKLLGQVVDKLKAENKSEVSGKDAFVLYDTFGFPLDLTELILKDSGFTVNQQEFREAMSEQKSRSKDDAAKETDDWVIVHENIGEGEFVGYDKQEDEVRITRYRKILVKKKELFQLVFDKTPFYAESGGQVGDTGFIEANGSKWSISDTQKENNLIVHTAPKLPENLQANFNAVVSGQKRQLTQNNHTATHLLQNALRSVLGNHVEQKGSYVDADRLRFDFTHFQKVTEEELKQVEAIVNQKIRAGIPLEEKRAVTMSEAEGMGAIAFFGEKYGDLVRVIKFGESIELCGGTHVPNTAQIGLLKIVSEGAVAAGVRRLEAITSLAAQNHLDQEAETLDMVRELLKNPQDVVKSVEALLIENSALTKQIEVFEREKLKGLKSELKNTVKLENGINIIAQKVNVPSANALKDLAFQLKSEIDDLFLVLGAELDGKANIVVMISESLTEKHDLNAGKIVRDAAKEIKGGGGGQVFFATAGGKDPQGIENALAKAVASLK